MSPIIKKKGEKFTFSSKYLLFILTAICVFLIIITFNTNLFVGTSGTALGYLFIPFQKGITSVATKLTDRTEELKRVKELLQENEELKEMSGRALEIPSVVCHNLYSLLVFICFSEF